jgi:hypothetical protein
MLDHLKSFSSAAQGLARNPLGIIALFIVLVYGFACLVVGSSSLLDAADRKPIIWFVVLFPVVVIGVFGWLVSKHHTKLYAPFDYKDERNFLGDIKSELYKLPKATPDVKKTSSITYPATENDWTRKRVEIYQKNKGFFLAHILEPSHKKGQEYDIFLFIVRHKSKDYADIASAEFYLGKYWGDKVFTGSQSGDYIGIRTSAYGPFLALCKLTFKDDTTAILSRYVDFEMGTAVKKLIQEP